MSISNALQDIGRIKISVRCLLCLVIILAVLTACSPPVPPPPTVAIEIRATSSMPAHTNTPTPIQVTPESTTVGSPLQPGTAEAAASPPTARVAVFDQSSAVDASRGGWWSIKILGPVGQTFRPSFAGLDAVELWTEDQSDAECSGIGAKLLVNIREATIEGPLVESSSTVALPDCFKGSTHFGFPALVSLMRDKVYVLEIVVISGDNWGVVWQQVPDPYPHGESIVLGESGDGDVWFREGLRNSTPLTEAYCKNDLWQHVQRANGSRFKNQEDCIQYIHIGK